LLIGDLFTDEVDIVWQPMESLYPPGKKPPKRGLRHAAGDRGEQSQ